ncbi:LytR/AlgR family response regulator transcription factor [Lacinutrix chionoecetis]
MIQRCIIIDDEQTARQIIKKYVSDISYLNLIGEFKNAIDALEFIQKETVDVIFLDIEMPKLSGIALAKILNNQTKVIFTTAHREFAVEGFELDAVDYLLKPFSFNRFLKATQRVIKNPITTITSVTNTFIYVKVNKLMVKINYAELQYIEGLSNYIKIHTSKSSYVVYEKMSDIINQLPGDQFMRIHKSYIINLKKVNAYTKEYVEIAKKHIPVSSTYRNMFMNSIK